MSQESVELLLGRMFALLSEEDMDWDAVSEVLAPDIVWEVRSDFPDAGIYRGYDGMRRLSAAFDEVFEKIRYRPLEYIHTGGHVVVPLRLGGLGVGSGAAFAAREETWVFTLRDRKIRHVREYATKKEALEAVGLRE
jgi:ketosteroid isomerase-like protein